ncbi:isopentenyl-diphosphate delta-isomerase idi1 [Hypoxylon texense]
MATTYGGGYSRTTYGATGGDDGGGFFGGSQSGSQAAKPVNDESLRPVTVKQIIDAEQAFGSDGPFRIDGVDVTQVTFVGMVRQINPQTTNITYRLDDGTGIMEVKLWLDPDKQDGDARAAFAEEQYVRVWGRLKSFGNKRHVGAHVIKPVADFNEVNYHLLEAAYVHLFFTKGGLVGGGEGGNNAAGGAAAGGNDDGLFVGDGDAAFLRSASPAARRVYQYLNQSEESNEGVNTHVIARDTGLSFQDVTTACEELLGHGKIYTTLDDETFAILQGF